LVILASPWPKQFALIALLAWVYINEVAFTMGLTFAGSSSSFSGITQVFVPFEHFLSFSSFLILSGSRDPHDQGSRQWVHSSSKCCSPAFLLNSVILIFLFISFFVSINSWREKITAYSLHTLLQPRPSSSPHIPPTPSSLPYIISLARVFRGSLGSLSSVLGHKTLVIYQVSFTTGHGLSGVSGVRVSWSVCVWLSHVSLGVCYLRSWSGVLLGSSGGKTIWGNLRRYGGGMDGMGCGGTWRARMLQADLSIVCHSMYLSFPYLRSSWCLRMSYLSCDKFSCD